MEQSIYFGMILTVIFCQATMVTCRKADRYQAVLECFMFLMCDCDETTFDYATECYLDIMNKTHVWILQKINEENACEKAHLTSTNFEHVSSYFCSSERDIAIECARRLGDEVGDHMLFLAASLSLKNQEEFRAIGRAAVCSQPAITMCKTYPGECMI